MNTVPGKILYLEGNGCTYTEDIDTFTGPILGGNGPSMTTNTRLEGYGTTLPIIQSPNPTGLSGVMLYLRNNDHFLTLKRLIFDGNNHVYNLGVLVAGTHHIRLEEVELKNSLSGGFEGLYIENSANLELVKVFLHHTGSHGLTLEGGIDTVLCEECHIFNATGKGVNVSSTGTKTNITISRPEIRNNGGDGLDHGSATGTTVQNMINHSNGGMGLRIRTGSSGTRVYNNTFYGNTGVGLQCDSGATTTELRNNIAYGNTAGNIVNNCGATVARNLCAVSSADCAVAGDPLFVAAPTDLHLSDGSPGINQGETLLSIPTDYSGGPRQIDGQDIGAYERTQAAPGGSDTTQRPRNMAQAEWFF
jgi:phage gp45-like